MARNIPTTYISFIEGITNVKEDGHSGFRSIAVAIGLPESEWRQIRQRLIAELRSKLSFYTDDRLHSFGGFGGIEECIEALDTTNSTVVKSSQKMFWLKMPGMSRIIANTFQRPVIKLSIIEENKCTTFPYFVGPNKNGPIVLACLDEGGKSQFVSVSLNFNTNKLILPKICDSWLHSHESCADQWPHKYLCEPTHTHPQAFKRPRRCK